MSREQFALSMEISADSKRCIDGAAMFRKINQFIRDIRPGDKFLLSSANDQLGMRCDGIPMYLEFIVFKKYPFCVELHHITKTWKWTYIHRYTPNYKTLYMLTDGRIIRDDTEASDRSLLLGWSRLQEVLEEDTM